MNRRNFLIGVAALFGSMAVAVASDKVYHYKCPTCHRVESSTEGGVTLYCEGTAKKPHSKTTMQRLSEEKADKLRQYECPTCHRVVSGEAGKTMYCEGTDKKPHSKTTMRELQEH